MTQARVEQGLSQTVVAARMGSSQSVVARIEQGNRDVRLSTLARYAAAVGRRGARAVRGQEPERDGQVGAYGSLERRRADLEFIRRLRRIIDEDRELLERLAR